MTRQSAMFDEPEPAPVRVPDGHPEPSDTMSVHRSGAMFLIQRVSTAGYAYAGLYVTRAEAESLHAALGRVLG